ncbi:hypothetical protein VKT23_011534 [Stygiomarasmius scandens]|uniref:Uncharacterized protein n=1 Tax=Marasmiellus scandens TaxID=2682957 RepID=A0ABR1JB48_9AGAR
MRSFKFTTFIILLLCIFEVSYALPAPARKAPKAPARPPSRPPVQTPAKPPAQTPARSAQTPASPSPANTKSTAAAPPPTTQATTSSTPPAVTSTPPKPSSALQPVTSSSASQNTVSSSVQLASSSQAVLSASSSSIAPSSSSVAPSSSSIAPSSSSIALSSSPVASSSSLVASSSNSIAPSSSLVASSSSSIASSQSPTNSTSAAQPTASDEPQGLSCPLPSNTTASGNKSKSKSVARRAFDGFASLFRRQGGAEFVGWHGTNGVNACQYTRAGRFGQGIPVLTEFNGADAELGAGLYVTDDIDTARFFAISSANARRNKGNTDQQATLATVCKVEAIDQTTWRNTISKFWIPFANLARPIPGQGNDPAALAQQGQLITNAGQNPANTVKFSALNAQTAGSTNQLAIPTSQFQSFRITECLPTTGADQDLVTRFSGVTQTNKGDFTHPGFDYQTFRQVANGPWGILGDQL